MSREKSWTSVGGMVRSSVPQVPLPHHGSVVACLLEQLCQRGLRKGKARHRPHSKVVCHPIPQAQPAGEQGGPGWGAGGGWRVKVCQSGIQLGLKTGNYCLCERF